MKQKTYSTYKPSGVEWIGEIPSHWAVKPLKRVSRYNTEVLSEATAADEMISYIEISDVDSQSGIRNSTEYTFKEAPSRARRLVKAGDTLVSTVRTYLKAVGVVQQEQNGFIASTGFCVLRPVDLESGFQGYVCKSRFIEEVARRSVGVSYPAINSTDLVEIPVPQPPYDEQQTISTYLDEKTALIDSTIRKKEKLIELLQEERTAIINQAVTRGLDPNVKVKDSGVEWLGEIPEHWDVQRFKYFTTLKNGYAFKSEKYVEDGVPVIRIGDIASPVNLDEAKKILPDEAEDLKEFIITKGDVLVALTGATIGKSCVYMLDETALLNQRVGLVKPTEKTTTAFLAFLISSDLFRRYIDIECFGGAQENIGKEQLGGFEFSLPPVDEQNIISSYLEEKTAQISSTISKKEKEISLLREYRISLINEVVTGKRSIFL